MVEKLENSMFVFLSKFGASRQESRSKLDEIHLVSLKIKIVRRTKSL